MHLHGKVLAVGGYAVLSPAGSGLALPVKSAFMDVSISVHSSGDANHASITLTRDGAQSVYFFPIATLDQYNPVDPEIAFVYASCIVLLAYLGRSRESLDIRIVTSQTQHPGAKLGIGSSAMVSVGVIVELAGCFGVDLKTPEVFVLSHFSCLLTQGQSSGYDIAVILNKTPILYKQNEKYMTQMMELVRASQSGKSLRALCQSLQSLASSKDLPKATPLSLSRFHFYLLKPKNLLNMATSTKVQLQSLQLNYVHSASFQKLVEASSALIDCFVSEESSDNHISTKLEEYRAAQQTFGRDNGVLIEPPEITAHINALKMNKDIIGGVCVGAGGYDAFLCIAASPVDLAVFKQYILLDINL